MSEEKDIAKAVIKPLNSISKIWLIPIVALLIGAWMIYFHLSNEGPLVTIYFETGDNIEAGKTKIKIKNVEIGLVEKLALNDNLKGIAVTARIRKQNSDLLKEGAQFWVVRPRVGKGGISGLGTLFSGTYIELSPGLSDEEKYEFIGLEDAPVTPAGTPGLHITLNNNSYRALQVGNPILFHGINVGRIEHVHFNTEETMVYYDAFIESPYNKLITTNTRFWEINGIEIDLSADGIRVQTGTLETMISGGVTFDVPKDMPRGNIITERDYFTIYPNKHAIYESRYKYEQNYILLFNESIRGLKPGAPVEYRGIKIGTVTRTDIEYPEITNLLKQGTLIPVMISIEPARMGYKDNENALSTVKKDIIKLLKKGLRGGLSTGNLLTGSKYVELQYDPGVMNAIETFSGHLVIPTLTGQFDQTIGKINRLVDKFSSLPLEPIISSADKTLQQVTSTLKELQGTVVQLEILLKQSADTNLVNNINGALENFEKLSADFSEGSLTHEELQNTLRSMNDAFAELGPLLSQLNKKPNSLIFGNGKNEDIEPKGVR